MSDEPKRQRDLEQSWEKTEKHLEAARRHLAQTGVSDRSLDSYHEMLQHNELELAFDELENLGLQNICRRGFWSELRAAAENMTLSDKAIRCRFRAQEALE
jgi:hypothetical protein